ncbi:MAG: hypothetical protein WDM85_15280 [Caulobacteraceae bacterium]
MAVSAVALLAACKPAASATAAAPGAAPAGGSLFGASVPAGPAPPSGMTTFTDPTENAFTVAVPQGWSVKGGVQRASPVAAKTWIQATSPDGSTVISLGDPQIPAFTLPSPQHAAGSTVQNASGVQSPVAPYENGAQFAADYAQRAFGASCAGLQQNGAQPAADLAQKAQDQMTKLAASVGAPTPQIQYDGAALTFSCQVGGAPYVVGVIDVTSLQQLNFGLGGWGVPIILSYRTPAASQAQTDQLARQMQASLQPKAQWTAQMAAAERQQLANLQQQGQQAQQQLAAMQQRDNAMLNANEAASNARLNAGHAAFMQQFNAQGAARNAAFAQQQYNKETGQQSEMRYINNQTCIAWYDAAHTRCRATAQQ